MDNRTNWINVVKFGGAYVACAIGSGFATGQEIMQFFTAFGKYSICAGLIALVLFSWFGRAIMEKGRELKLKTASSIIRYYLGDKFGLVFEYFTQLFLFSVFVIMISGAGATLAEYYGLNSYVGRVVMALISLLTVLLGLERLLDILGAIGPAIIIFSIVVGLTSILGNIEGLKNASAVMKTISVPRAANSWITGGILYPAYNVVALIIFLAGIGASAKTSREAILGGTLGGFFLIIAALVMNFGLLANIEYVYDKQVPALFLADKISPVVGILFSVILIAGIYTSAVPMLWAVCNKFSEEKSKKFYILAVSLTIAAFLLGLLPFDKLVGTIYPYTGYVGIVIILSIFYKTYMNEGNIEAFKKRYSLEE